MPTLTNPETGETKEISMEEFMKMMRSGNPMAVVELSKVETASDAELEHLAKQASIDTNNNNRNPFSW